LGGTRCPLRPVKKKKKVRSQGGSTKRKGRLGPVSCTGGWWVGGRVLET